MKSDLSTAAREAAHAPAERIWRHNEHRRDGNECVECVFRQSAFMDGAAWCASRIPSEEELAEAINRLDWGYMVDGPSVGEIAKTVLALIGERISG